MKPDLVPRTPCIRRRGCGPCHVPVAVYLPGPPHARYTADLKRADALISDGWAAKHLPSVIGAPVDDVLKGVDTRLFTPDGPDMRAARAARRQARRACA